MNNNTKVAIVTGAAQGLGKAITTRFLEEGFKVMMADIQTEALKKNHLDFEQSFSGQSAWTQLNVTDYQSCQNAVDETVNTFGRLDYLINNAGVDVTKPVAELSEKDWSKVISVNLNGPFLMSKASLRGIQKNQGHIVNVASTAAKRTWPNASAYHASKWGLLGFSHALHAELRAENVKVTAVVAGGMKTPFILERFPEVDPNVLQDPKNVADTIVYVLSQPKETVIPEVMVLPMKETSWP